MLNSTRESFGDFLLSTPLFAAIKNLGRNLCAHIGSVFTGEKMPYAVEPVVNE